jgi:hypothetical protein
MDRPVPDRRTRAEAENRWRQQRDMYLQARQQVLSQDTAAYHASTLVMHSLEIADACAALGDWPATTAALHDLCDAGLAALLRLRFPEGVITLGLSDATVALPPGDSPLFAPLWLNAVSAACLIHDRVAAVALCDPQSVECMLTRSASHAPLEKEPFWPALCRAMAAWVRGDLTAAQEQADLASTAMLDNGIDEHTQTGIWATKLPLTELLMNEPKPDDQSEGSTWDGQLRRAAEVFAQYYADPRRTALSAGFLPLPLAALAALAHDRGAKLTLATTLPQELIEAPLRPCDVQLFYEYPRQSARSAGEIRWWFDLEGVPREGRSHELFDADGMVCATYRIDGWAAVPIALATFDLDPDGKPLLDPCELVLVAENQAQQVEALQESTNGELPTLLREALHALDEALLAIPAGATRIPAATCMGERSAKLLAANPARFERSNIEALRHKLNRTLHQYKDRADVARSTSPEAQGRARMQVLSAVNRVRSQVTPMLQQLAQDRSGQITRSLRPRATDYEKTFLGPALAAARQVYEPVWEAPVDIILPTAAQTQLLCYITPASMLSTENELSCHFPAGYRALAPWLEPQRLWLAWRYVRPGESKGLFYDGLVWCDDHWVWFPKPHQMLASFMAKATA